MVEPRQAPVTRTSLSSQVYDILKRKIITCALQPGQNVVEKEVCQELAVSRTPVREALNRLSQEGLVSLVPFRGFVVTGITSKEIRDLCELRCILEAGVASLAAARATPEDCAHLVRVADIHYQPGDRRTYDRYLEANTAFHSALVDSTRNASLRAAVVSILGQIQRPLYLGLDVGLDPQAATREHLELVEAIRSHDQSRASSLAYHQIKRAEERMIKALEAAEGSISPAEMRPDSEIPSGRS